MRLVLGRVRGHGREYKQVDNGPHWITGCPTENHIAPVVRWDQHPNGKVSVHGCVHGCTPAQIIAGLALDDTRIRAHSNGQEPFSGPARLRTGGTPPGDGLEIYEKLKASLDDGYDRGRGRTGRYECPACGAKGDGHGLRVNYDPNRDRRILLICDSNRCPIEEILEPLGMTLAELCADDDTDDLGEEDSSGDEREPSFLDRLRAALLDSARLGDVPQPEPLIDGVIYRDSLVWVQGKSGDGKSFVALDAAGCVGTGQQWQLHPVKQGLVLYIVAEGVSGMRWRVRAWEKAMGVTMTGVQWLPMPVQADLDEQWTALVDLARELKPALIVVDTQARVTVGMEENAAKDMGVFVDQLERLRKASGACILVVHHQGRNGEHMRGSTALEGAATTVIRVVKEENEITLSCLKQKDAEPFDDIQLRLVPTGDSATLMPSDGGGRAGQNSAAMKMARKWWELFGTDLVTESKVVGAEVATKPTFYRNVKELVRSGLVHKDTDSARYTQYRFIRQPDPPEAETAGQESDDDGSVRSRSGGPPLRGGGPDRTNPPRSTGPRPDHTGPPDQEQEICPDCRQSTDSIWHGQMCLGEVI
jgi:hypothetical protein